MTNFTPLRALSDPDALVSNAVNALAGRIIAQVDAAQLPAKVVAAPEPKVEAPEIAAIDAAMRAVVADTANKRAATHADAVRVVLRAKALEGHDLTATRLVDALAIDIIRRALDDVRHAPNAAIADAFVTHSDPKDVDKGAAVVALMTTAAE